MSLVLLFNAGEQYTGSRIVSHPLGTSGSPVIMTGFGLQGNQSFPLGLLEATGHFRRAINSLLYGDPVFGDRVTRSSLSGEVTGQQVHINRLSEAITGIERVMSSLLRGDPVGNLQFIANCLSGELVGLQSALTEISGGAGGIHEFRNTMSGDPISSIFTHLNDLALVDYVTGTRRVINALQNVVPITPDVTWGILLDGADITHQVTSLSMSFTEDDIHNQVELASISNDLFRKSSLAEGIHALQVTINEEVYEYVLEDQQGTEDSFNLWGRSKSALWDAPYREEIALTLEVPALASEVATTLLNDNSGIDPVSLTWDCEDWVLPKTYSYNGQPLAGISEIAEAIGAVVRSQSDGTLVIRNKFPARPIHIPTTAAVARYDRSNMIEVSTDYERGTGVNTIEVSRQTTAIELPDYRVEEESLDVGDPTHVRLYWAGNRPHGGPVQFVTDGTVQSLGSGLIEEVESEIVIVKNGMGETSRPIKSLEPGGVEWIGRQYGQPTFDVNGKEVVIPDNQDGVLKLSYTTEYERLLLLNHSVEILLAVLSIAGETDVALNVTIPPGDVSAPSLHDELLSTPAIAVVAGTAALDAARYDQKAVSLSSPYKISIMDGDIVHVDDSEISALGNFQVKSVAVTITGPKVLHTMEVIQWQV